MKSYKNYKKWWIKHVSHSYVGNVYYGDTEEEAFEQHVKDMGLYNLMETLADWE